MIKFIMDLENQTWDISGSLGPEDSVIEFYIDMIPGKTPFKNFDYNFEMAGSNSEFVEVILDESAINNQPQTEFPYLVNRHFLNKMIPDDHYTFNVQFKNRREFVDGSYTVVFERPRKPFDSWVWNSKIRDWVAPKAPPQMIWDEGAQQWVLP